MLPRDSGVCVREGSTDLLTWGIFLTTSGPSLAQGIFSLYAGACREEQG